MGKFRQFLAELSANDMSVFSFLDDNFSEYQWTFTKLGMCIALILWRSAFRLLMGKCSIFDSYLPAIHPYFTFRTIT